MSEPEMYRILAPTEEEHRAALLRVAELEVLVMDLRTSADTRGERVTFLEGLLRKRDARIAELQVRENAFRDAVADVRSVAEQTIALQKDLAAARQQIEELTRQRAESRRWEDAAFDRAAEAEADRDDCRAKLDALMTATEEVKDAGVSSDSWAYERLFDALTEARKPRSDEGPCEAAEKEPPP